MDRKESCKRYIGFFDIMGFKNLVYRNSHKSVKKTMDTLCEIVEEINNSQPTSVPEIHNSIRVVMFSDSILFVTKDDSLINLNNFLLTSGWFVAKCFEKNIPIKGALSYGMVTANFEKSIFFGKALIDAYALQEELQVYGCVLSNQIEKQMEKLNVLDNNKWVKKVKVPLKGGIVTHLIINWIVPVEKFSEKEIREQVEKFYLSTSGLVRRYIDNTIDQINELLKK